MAGGFFKLWFQLPNARPDIPENYNLIAYCNEKLISSKNVYFAFQRTPAALFLNLFLSTYPMVTD
jgi:hypothetical protein